MNTLKILFELLCIAVLIITSILFGFFENNVAMALGIAAAISVYLMFNPEKIENITVAGIYKVKMREINKVIDEAYFTIENLQKLSLALAEPILVRSALDLAGMTHRITINTQIELRNQTVNALKNLNIPSNEISPLTNHLDKSLLCRHFCTLIDGLTEEKANIVKKNEMNDQLVKISKDMDNTNETNWSCHKSLFLELKGLVTDRDADKLIVSIIDFLDKKTLDMPSLKEDRV